MRPTALRLPDAGRRRARQRRGFTLLELLAALSLSGVVLLGAVRLLDQLADGRDAVSRLTLRQSERVNGERLLRALVYGMESGADSNLRFTGEDRMTRFTTWCTVPAGWMERCDVTLRPESVGDSVHVTAAIEGGPPMVLWGAPGSGEFRYFSANGALGQWWRGWGTTTHAPAAVGVVTPTDTLVLLVGAGS